MLDKPAGCLTYFSIFRANITNKKKWFAVIDPKLLYIILPITVMKKINSKAAYICIHQQIDRQMIAIGIDRIMKLFRADRSQADMA